MAHKRFRIYWALWFLLLLAAICTAAIMRFHEPGTTDIILPFIFLFFTAIIGVSILHFIEGTPLVQYVWKHYQRRILIMSNISILSFVYSRELSDDPNVQALKQNYKHVIWIEINIIITYFCGILLIFFFA